jgi:hypothetical protein
MKYTADNIPKIIDASIEEIFYKVVDDNKMPSGDWSPEQELELKLIKRDLTRLVREYISENSI